MNSFIKKYINELHDCVKNPLTPSKESYEIIRRCLNVLGDDLNINENIFYWEDSYFDEDAKMLIDILEYNLSKTTSDSTASTENTIKDKVFISHRTEDKKIARILANFLTACGTPRDKIFVSSLPGNDVGCEISKEVKDNLKVSTFNIVILSSDYYKSAYCQNEAGIIWFLDVPKMIIALPDINEKDMQGFLNSEYKIRRLDDRADMLYLAQSIVKLYPNNNITTVNFNEYIDDLIEDYKTYVVKTKHEINTQSILKPDSNGCFITTISEERYAGPNYRCLKIDGLLPLSVPYESYETHWLLFSKTLYPELKKGDKVKFIPTEIKPIRHFADLKNTRNIYFNHLEIV